MNKKLGPVLTLDLDQFVTLETPNLGPVFNSTACIYIYIYAVYIYIYVYAVEFLSGPSLAFFNRHYLVQVCFLAVSVKKDYKIGVSADFY